MSLSMILRLPADPREAVDALLDRLYLLSLEGEAVLTQFGRQRRARRPAPAAAGDALVLVVAFQSAAAAEGFVANNAGLLAGSVEEPLFFEPLEHSTSNVLPPLFA